MSTKNLEKLKQIKFVAFDFDGVFTDNKVYISSEGVESVCCTRADGIGLDLLRKLGISMAIFSTEKNPVVARRAEKLKLDCYHGCEDKLAVLKDQMSKRNIELLDVAFIGNDRNDSECLQSVGLSVAVQDAWEPLKSQVDLVLECAGGQGAVREFCELIYKTRT